MSKAPTQSFQQEEPECDPSNAKEEALQAELVNDADSTLPSGLTDAPLISSELAHASLSDFGTWAAILGHAATPTGRPLAWRHFVRLLPRWSGDPAADAMIATVRVGLLMTFLAHIDSMLQSDASILSALSIFREAITRPAGLVEPLEDFTLSAVLASIRMALEEAEANPAQYCRMPIPCKHATLEVVRRRIDAATGMAQAIVPSASSIEGDTAAETGTLTASSTSAQGEGDPRQLVESREIMEEVVDDAVMAAFLWLIAVARKTMHFVNGRRSVPPPSSSSSASSAAEGRTRHPTAADSGTASTDINDGVVSPSEGVDDEEKAAQPSMPTTIPDGPSRDLSASTEPDTETGTPSTDHWLAANIADIIAALEQAVTPASSSTTTTSSSTSSSSERDASAADQSTARGDAPLNSLPSFFNTSLSPGGPLLQVFAALSATATGCHEAAGVYPEGVWSSSPPPPLSDRHAFRAELEEHFTLRGTLAEANDHGELNRISQSSSFSSTPSSSMSETPGKAGRVSLAVASMNPLDLEAVATQTAQRFLTSSLHGARAPSRAVAGEGSDAAFLVDGPTIRSLTSSASAVALRSTKAKAGIKNSSTGGAAAPEQADSPSSSSPGGGAAVGSSAGADDGDSDLAKEDADGLHSNNIVGIDDPDAVATATPATAAAVQQHEGTSLLPRKSPPSTAAAASRAGQSHGSRSIPFVTVGEYVGNRFDAMLPTLITSFEHQLMETQRFTKAKVVATARAMLQRVQAAEKPCVHTAAATATATSVENATGAVPSTTHQLAPQTQSQQLSSQTHPPTTTAPVSSGAGSLASASAPASASGSDASVRKRPRDGSAPQGSSHGSAASAAGGDAVQNNDPSSFASSSSSSSSSLSSSQSTSVSSSTSTPMFQPTAAAAAQDSSSARSSANISTISSESTSLTSPGASSAPTSSPSPNYVPCLHARRRVSEVVGWQRLRHEAARSLGDGVWPGYVAYTAAPPNTSASDASSSALSSNTVQSSFTTSSGSATPEGNSHAGATAGRGTAMVVPHNALPHEFVHLNRQPVALPPLLGPLASIGSLPELCQVVSPVQLGAEDEEEERTMEYIEACVPLLGSSRPDDQINAAVHLRQLLSVAKHPLIDEVIDSGALPLLVKLLSDNPRPHLQFEVAWALTNVASGTSAHVKALISHDAVPRFVDLLTSRHDDVVEQATWALGNIAGDSTQSRDAVLDAGALELMQGLCSRPIRVPLQRNLAWAISNLCRGRPAPHFNHVNMALGSLRCLLKSTDAEVLKDTCWGLSYLADDASNDSRQVDLLIGNGLDAAVIELLGHPNEQVQTAALRIIANIVTGSDRQTQAVIESGALGALSKLLFHSNKAIRKETCWCVSNILAGTPEHIGAVVSAGMISPLLDLLQSSDEDIRKEATWALSNATSGGDAVIAEIVRLKALPALARMISASDVQISSVVVEGLENVLKHGWRRKRVPVSEKYAIPGAVSVNVPSHNAASSTNKELGSCLDPNTTSTSSTSSPDSSASTALSTSSSAAAAAASPASAATQNVATATVLVNEYARSLRTPDLLAHLIACVAEFAPEHPNVSERLRDVVLRYFPELAAIRDSSGPTSTAALVVRAALNGDKSVIQSATSSTASLDHEADYVTGGDEEDEDDGSFANFLSASADLEYEIASSHDSVTENITDEGTEGQDP